MYQVLTKTLSLGAKMQINRFWSSAVQWKYCVSCMCNFTISNSQFCLKKKDKKKVKLILVVDFISPNLSIGKDSDAGRDWGQEEKGTTEDEMAGWHH